MIRGKEMNMKSKDDVQRLNIDLKASIHNRFDVEVVDALTGEVKQKAVGYNVICSNLWSKLLVAHGASDNSYFKYIHYGTGSGTPSSSDTRLFNFYGYVSADTSTQSQIHDYENGIYQLRRRGQISPETAVGQNISEVGIAYGTGATTLCTHAMLQDMNGNPISILKTDTDIINIYASVFLHFAPNGYSNGSVIFIDNSISSFALNICGGYTRNGWPTNAIGSELMGGFSQNRSGSQEYTNSMILVTNSYDIANRKMICSLGRFSVNASNRPIRMILIFGEYYDSGTSYMGLCMALLSGKEEGWFPPYSIEGESVGTGNGVKTVFSTAFPFATNAKVYIDGVEVTEGVTVDAGLNRCNYPDIYMSRISNRSTVNNIIPDFSSSFNRWPEMYSGGSAVYDNANILFYPTGSNSGWNYYYNVAHEESAVTRVGSAGFTFEVSDDMINWINLGTTTSSSQRINVPQQYQHYKFWRYKSGSSYIYVNFEMTSVAGNITFDTPPAEGSVITVDYDTSVIPKDSNHVLDVSVTIQFAEYTET